ncbi:MAG: hypothetical protein ACFE9C_09885 [Candidatus Hodarchaeota archaeon]
MPYIIRTITYPSHKRNDVIKKYREVRSKYPPDESLGELVAQPVTITKNGIKLMVIFEPKEGKFEEAFKRARTLHFEFTEIEGYESEITVWATFPEAAEIAGIPLSE